MNSRAQSLLDAVNDGAPIREAILEIGQKATPFDLKARFKKRGLGLTGKKKDLKKVQKGRLNLKDSDLIKEMAKPIMCAIYVI
ncbi:hypothetical protein JYU19_02105 [bacterium AH-315-J21]|nr:hypothetical protein [bacterium AH-315-J21]